MSKKIPVHILLCTKCNTNTLIEKKDYLECKNCKTTFKISGETPFFHNDSKQEPSTDLLSTIKEYFKTNDALYYFIMTLISPVHFGNNFSKFIKEQSNKNQNNVILNLGSGNSDYKNISNIDYFYYPNVNLVADIHNLPIKSGSVDTVIIRAVLEHVKNPEAVVKEIHRVLKKNGTVNCMFPFIQGYHASPHDYSRRTKSGMLELFKDFEMVELVPFGGPTSGMLWVMQEWLAIVLSFGIKQLHLPIHLLTMLLTFPIKYLDIILIHHPLAKNISSGFTYIGNKPNHEHTKQ